MGLSLHTVEITDGSALTAKPDRLQVWSAYGLVSTIGGGAGLAVTVAVAVPKSAGLPSSGNYFIDVELSQDATYFITAKTASGFTVNILPRLAANTLAAGTINVNVQY